MARPSAGKDAAKSWAPLGDQRDEAPVEHLRRVSLTVALGAHARAQVCQLAAALERVKALQLDLAVQRFALVHRGEVIG